MGADLAGRVDDARKRLGLTRDDLEKRAGLSKGYLSRLLRGERGKQIGAETIAKLARALEVTESWLSRGEGTEDATPASSNGPRYPNLRGALDYLRARGRLSPKTEEAALSIALHSPRDLDESTWISMIDDLDRKLRSGGPIGRELTDADLPPPRAARRARGH